MSRRSEIQGLKRRIEERLEERRPWRVMFYGLLGDHSGNVAVDPDEPRLVYVRREGRALIRNVVNVKAANIADLPVSVGYTDEYPNTLQVLSEVAGSELGWALGNIGLVSDHHRQHEFRKDGTGGNDVVWVAMQQVTDGLVYPPTTAGLQVNTHKCTYAYGTQAAYFAATENSLNAELTAAEAALGAGQANWTIIYIDTTVDPHVLDATTSAAFPTVLFPPEGFDSLPNFPVGSIPLAGVYIEEGDTAITWSNLYDMRMFPMGVSGVVAASQHELLDGDVHPDTEDADPVQGDLIIADATPEWIRLAVGAADKVLKSDGTDPSWDNVGHDELTDVAADDHHDPVTLGAAEIQAIFDLAAQALTLDTQTENTVLAGPAAAPAAKPAFRALVDADLAGVSASGLSSYYEPVTNGDAANPELVFADGDVVMVEVAI